MNGNQSYQEDKVRSVEQKLELEILKYTKNLKAYNTQDRSLLKQKML